MRLTLLHPHKPTPIQRWQFRAVTQVSVGRSQYNHVVVPDLLVSRFHLALHRVNTEPSQEVWQLHSSAGSTLLNNQLVSRATLTPGSTIRLGLTGPRLYFELSPPKIARRRPRQGIARHCDHQGNPPEHLFCIYCGQPLKVLKTIRHYQVLKVLGRGGMGTTFLVRSRIHTAGHPPLQVLKQMNANMIQIPKARELFEREARVLRSLHHPGIPQLFDTFVENQRPYLVMEWIQGQSLHQWVCQHGPVATRQAGEWLLQVCNILNYLHHRTPPVIHRDLKPSNLLLRARDQRLFMIDFGAVKEMDAVSGTRIAVEGYSAPEQGLGRPQVQSDLLVD